MDYVFYDGFGERFQPFRVKQAMAREIFATPEVLHPSAMRRSAKQLVDVSESASHRTDPAYCNISQHIPAYPSISQHIRASNDIQLDLGLSDFKHCRQTPPVVKKSWQGYRVAMDGKVGVVICEHWCIAGYHTVPFSSCLYVVEKCISFYGQVSGSTRLSFVTTGRQLTGKHSEPPRKQMCWPHSAESWQGPEASAKC